MTRPPFLTAAALDSVGLAPNGDPATPVQCVLLDDWASADADTIERAATAISGALPITVGIVNRPLTPALRRLVDALTLTLAGPDSDPGAPELIAVPDPQAAYAELAAAITHRPRASIALGQLLRQTPSLGTTAGLAAEAAVYSMLLGGTEFAAWRTEHPDLPAPPTSTGAPVRIERSDEGLGIVLDRPDRRNSLSFALREALLEALQLADLDESITAVELSGAGPVFCSGGDLGEFGTATDLVAAYLVRLDRAPWRVIDRLRERLGHDMSVRVQGAAVGAGLEMAAFAGQVASTPEAQFWLPELEMGLVPGAGGTVSVVRRIGRWRAAWLMLTGSRIDASTALAWGLIDELIEES